MQLGGSTGQPSVDCQQDDRCDKPDVGGRKVRGPGQVGQHQCEQRRVGRGDHRPGRGQCFPDGCLAGKATPLNLLARTSAYSSASQYTSNVTTTEITSAAVDRWPPAVSRIAAVMMAPYIPAARRRPRFFVAGETDVHPR